MARTVCPHCGKEVSDQAEFCMYCGNSLKQEANQICPNCGAVLKKDDSFCFQCGKPCGNVGINTQTSKPQSQSVSPDSTIQMTNQKKKPTALVIGIAVTVMLAIVIGGFFIVQDLRESAYRQQVSDLASKMQDGFVSIEDNAIQMDNVIYAWSRKVSDPTTDPYTQDMYGIFYQDVNDAIRSLCADEEYKARQKNIQANQTAVKETIDRLKNAPKDCEDIQDKLETCAYFYQLMADSAMDNNAISAETFTAEYNAISSEAISAYLALMDSLGVDVSTENALMNNDEGPSIADGTPLSVARAWDAWLAKSYENEAYFFVDDYDCDGDAEAFGITGSIYDGYEGIYQQVAIYFVNSQGDISLVCNTQPGSDIFQLYGYFGSTDEIGQPMLLTPVESENKFIVWEMDDGFTDSVSLIWGVKNDQPYQPYVSGEFQHFNAAIVGYPNAYQIDYSQGEPVRTDYRFEFDLSTGQFIPEIDDWWME